MTTAHESETDEPDGGVRQPFDVAASDPRAIHRGPAFAPSDGDTRDDVYGADGADGVLDLETDDDGDFAPRPRQRFGALSAVLVVVLAVALGFLGGEIIQKHYGTTAAASGTANRAVGFARGEGAAGFGGNAGGFGQPGTAGTGTGTGTGTTGSSATPAVIGVVSSLKGTTLIVTNLGGAKVTVHLSGATTVTVPVKDKALKVGQTVAVVGKTAAKVVTATSIVVQ